MSEKNAKQFAAIHKAVDDALDVLHKTRRGEPVDEVEFADALAALEVYMSITRRIVLNAKPALVEKAVLAFSVTALEDKLKAGKPLPPADKTS